MISLSTIDHLQSIRDARFSNELRLGTARLAATKEQVAVVVKVEEIERDTRITTTLGMLRPADTRYVERDGSLTQAAKSVFETLKAELFNGNETWLSEDAHGRVHVGFAKRGTPGDERRALITLPWADPKDTFEAPVVTG
jgi:hypothetical protein